MASLSREINITIESRPCIARGRKALFHKWSDKSEILSPSPMLGGHTGGVLKYTVGIVEYENGGVSECYPSEIRFVDGKFKEYAFED